VAGADADLVLLDGDPLQDIANTQSIEGVMVRGRWLDRAYLDRGLEEMEKRMAGR
jgi:imidazolonepropionase-like amidohydrolase